MAGTCTQDVRKVGAEPKSNNNSGAERPRWADYEDFEEDVDDIGDGGFKDETIGYRKGFWQPRDEGISCILMMCYGKKMRIQKERWYQGREIKRFVF